MFYLDREFEVTKTLPLLESQFAEPKQCATLRARDGSTVEVVIKNVSRHCPSGLVPSEWYLSIWKSYTEAGISTHEWMEAVDANNVVMPNLYAEGWSIYGKSSYASIPLKKFAVPLCERDLLATALLPEEIEEKAILHLQKASIAGIVLPSDDLFELTVHETGVFCIRTHDLSYSGNESREKARRLNHYRFRQAMMRVVLSLDMINELYFTNPEMFAIGNAKALSQLQ